LKSALKAAPLGKLQARDLREKLEPILDKNLWTKFWAKARKLAKDDPWIEVGAAPKSVVQLRAQPLSRDAEVSKNVDRAGPFVKKLEAARRELLAVAKDFVAKGQVPGWLKSGIAAMQKDVETPPKGRPSANWPAVQRAMRLELALFRLESANLMPHTAAELGVQAPEAAAGAGEAVDPETGEPLGPQAKPTTVPAEVQKALEGLAEAELPAVLREMTVQEYRRRIIGLSRVAFPSNWQDRLRAIVLDPASGVFDAAARELSDGARNVLDEACQKILVNPTKHPDAFCALVRARMNGRVANLVEKRTDVELVAKAIQVLDDVTHRFKAAADRAPKEALKATVDAFRSLFSEKNQRVITSVVNKERSESDVRRILQLVRQSPSLTPTVVRACEAAVVDCYPELLSTVVAAPKVEKEIEEKLFTTQDGYNKRRQEYDRLVNVELEEVRLEIGRALEFGDISENSELDAAREKQKQLALRIERMRTELEQVVIIDPATVETDEVRVGTRVVLRYKPTNKEETFTVLGPWDADEAHHVISFLSPLARALMSKRVGDEVQVLLPDGSKPSVEILSIGRATTHVPQHAS
jgi:transcription elongation factor GreA